MSETTPSHHHEHNPPLALTKLWKLALGDVLAETSLPHTDAVANHGLGPARSYRDGNAAGQKVAVAETRGTGLVPGLA